MGKEPGVRTELWLVVDMEWAGIELGVDRDLGWT
jgi:hypothetical protein